MKCPFPDEAMKAVISYLRRTGKTITCIQGEYNLVARGVLNIGTIERAFCDRAISIQEDGSILICGVSVPCEWDTMGIRRRIEEHLRKSASNEELIRIATCLGLRLK
jgi:hypothetical protein